MQNQELKDLWERLEAVRGDVLRLIESAAEPELAYVAPGGKNPAAVIARHLAGAESYWIGQLLGGIDAGRNRDAEFTHPLWTRAQLLEGLSKSRDVSEKVFRSLNGGSLDRRLEGLKNRPAHAPADMTARWAILHVLEHEASHLGQLSVLLRAARAIAEESREVRL